MMNTNDEVLDPDRDYQDVHDNENELFEDLALAIERWDAKAVRRIQREADRWPESPGTRRAATAFWTR